MPTCRLCPAEVLWVTNGSSGKRMCLDALPDAERGNVIVNRPTMQAEVVNDPLEARMLRERGQVLYLDHHATCPAARRVDAGELVGQEVLF